MSEHERQLFYAKIALLEQLLYGPLFMDFYASRYKFAAIIAARTISEERTNSEKRTMHVECITIQCESDTLSE